MFRLHATEITEAFINDEYLKNDPEYMPGDYAILYKDLRVYRKGESFIVRKIENGKSTSEFVEYNPEVQEAFIYYYGIWHALS